jgi:hypothetical protein
MFIFITVFFKFCSRSLLFIFYHSFLNVFFSCYRVHVFNFITAFLKFVIMLQMFILITVFLMFVLEHFCLFLSQFSSSFVLEHFCLFFITVFLTFCLSHVTCVYFYHSFLKVLFSCYRQRRCSKSWIPPTISPFSGFEPK